MNAFEKAFGPKTAQPEVIAQDEGLGVKEKMLISLMKQLLPGFDLQAIANLGNSIQGELTFFKASLARIEGQNAQILKALAELEIVTDDGTNHSNGLNAVNDGTGGVNIVAGNT